MTGNIYNVGLRCRIKRKNGFGAFIAFILLIVLSVSAFFIYLHIMHIYYPKMYSDEISKASAKYNVPESVIYAVIHTESHFDPSAVSLRGATGLMQIMPDTFEWIAGKRKEKVTEEMLLIPEINIDYGVYYLSYLNSILGDWELVYASYNAGINRVREWLENPEYSDNGALVNIPYPETESYVEKVIYAKDKYCRLYKIDR